MATKYQTIRKEYVKIFEILSHKIYKPRKQRNSLCLKAKIQCYKKYNFSCNCRFNPIQAFDMCNCNTNNWIPNV